MNDVVPSTGSAPDPDDGDPDDGAPGNPAGGSHAYSGPGAHPPRDGHGSLGRAVAVGALGTVLPGTGFLAAGRRVLGAVTLGLFVLLVGFGIWLGTAGRRTAAHWAVEPRALVGVIVAVAVVALLWLVVVVAQYLLLAPRRAAGWQHAVGTVVVLVLAAVVALPAAEAAHLASVQHGLIAGVFSSKRSATAPTVADPFNQNRVNVLLLGGDDGPGRTGTRTDTFIVASIDTHTGATTLFSLPRNLENVPFPANSPLAALYPHGFKDRSEDEGLLNAIYDNGPAEHPGVLGPSDNPGADWDKLAAEAILGIPIDYYVLVDLQGFSQMVNALGGVTVNINYYVPINGTPDTRDLPDNYLAPGQNVHLNGDLALKFARGRFGLSDYLRMQRQRCVLGALLKAANPTKVLESYQQLATSTENAVLTDIPQSVLPDFVDLAFQAKKVDVRSVVFDDSVINPAYPDFAKIRSIVAATLNPESAAAATTAVGSASASASAGATGAPASSSAGSPASPTGLPVADVTNACAYNPAQAAAALAAGKPPSKNLPEPNN